MDREVRVDPGLDECDTCEFAVCSETVPVLGVAG